MVKVSIHGPDPKHVGKQHFRLDFDHEDPATKAVKAGGGWSTDALQLPLYFDGRRVNKLTLHIVRFSAEADMYAKGIPSAPYPTVKQKATLHAAVAAPPPGKVTHVDLFLSTVRPYWPNENKTRARGRWNGTDRQLGGPPLDCRELPVVTGTTNSTLSSKVLRTVSRSPSANAAYAFLAISTF